MSWFQYPLDNFAGFIFTGDVAHQNPSGDVLVGSMPGSKNKGNTHPKEIGFFGYANNNRPIPDLIPIISTPKCMKTVIPKGFVAKLVLSRAESKLEDSSDEFAHLHYSDSD